LYTYENLKEEFKDEVTMLFNTFFHELCHINVNFHTRKIFDEDIINKCSVLPKNLYLISIIMWQEYYAYRKSTERFPHGDLMFTQLEETSEWAYKEVVKLPGKLFCNDTLLLLSANLELYHPSS